MPDATRALLDLLGHCRGHAINLGHQKIEEVDFSQGESAYSTDLVNQISWNFKMSFMAARKVFSL